MPSTQRQKAKAGKSREMDMMSDLDTLDIMLGSGDDNPIEKELASAIEQSSVQGDNQDDIRQNCNYWEFIYENDPPRQNDIGQSFETISNELNLRLCLRKLSMVHNQINRAISSGISERVIPEIQLNCTFNVIFGEQGHWGQYVP